MVTLRQQPDTNGGTDHPTPQPQQEAGFQGAGVVTAEAEPA